MGVSRITTERPTLHEIAVEQGFTWRECVEAASLRRVPLRDGRIAADGLAGICFGVHALRHRAGFVRGERVIDACGDESYIVAFGREASDGWLDDSHVLLHRRAPEYDEGCYWNRVSELERED